MPLAEQTLFAQHGCPIPPQATHELAEQTVPPAQMLPQHGWLRPPQVTHLLLLQVAPLLQFVPQHGWFAAPHATHVDDAVEQTNDGAQFDPGQQGCVEPPQVPQVPFMQMSVEAVQAPAQHACPVPPHGVQVPAAQTNPSPHELPPQHG